MPAAAPASIRGTTYTPAQLAGAARAAGFPAGEIATATAVALAESSGRASVISVSGDYGPWQINALAHPDKLTASTQWWDVNVSAGLAKRIYDEATGRGKNGWSPWTVYRTGAYREYLDDANAVAGDGAAVENAAFPKIPNPLDPLFAVGDMVSAVTAVGNAVKGMAQAVWKAMTWANDTNNWKRAALVLLGGLMVIGGLIVAVRPVEKLKVAAQIAGKAKGAGKALKTKAA